MELASSPFLPPSSIKLRKLYQDNPRACFEDKNGLIYGIFRGKMRSGNTLDMWIVVPPIRAKNALLLDMDALETRYRPPILQTVISLWRGGGGGAGDGIAEYSQVQLVAYTTETRRMSTSFRVQVQCVECLNDDFL